MTLAEIIVDVLNIVHPVGGELLTAETLSEYLEDDQYSDEILRVPGAVNRAMADMELRRILNGWGPEEDGRLRLPELHRVTLGTRDEDIRFESGNAEEPDRLPDRYCRLLVHYAAAELYQHDEPGLGAYYRNMYEQGCEAARIHENGRERQDVVETVYGI